MRAPTLEPQSPDVSKPNGAFRLSAGLFISILGPDGAGKSTLISRLAADLAGAFPDIAVYHLRPRAAAAPTGGPVVTDPHGKPPRSLWLSVLKMAYYPWTYGVGYAVGVRPRVARSGLVILDRYYDDMLVDPRRHRYGGPMWLARLVRHLVRSPDLTIVLDVAPRELLRRKRELPEPEAERQRQAYRSLAAARPTAILLEASHDVGSVARSAHDIILEYARLRSRPGSALRDASEVPWVTRIVFGSEAPREAPRAAAPSGEPADNGSLPAPVRQRGVLGHLRFPDGRGYLIPLDSVRVAPRALDLYNPQTTKAKAGKALLAAGLRLGLGTRCLPRVGVFGNDTGTLVDHLRGILGRDELCVGVSCGTPGPDRKPVLSVHAPDGKVLAYAKVGWNDMTNALVRHEVEVVRRLNSTTLRSFAAPCVVYAGPWRTHYISLLSAPAGRARPLPRRLAPQLLHIPDELASLHMEHRPLDTSDAWARILTRVEDIPNAHYRTTLQRGIRIAAEWAGDLPLPFHFSHGDFMLWNVKLHDGMPFVFDWEYADPAGLPARDVVHFLWQSLREISRRSPDRAYVEIAASSAHRVIASHLVRLGAKDTPPLLCILLYSLERLTRDALRSPGTLGLFRDMRALANFLCTVEEPARKAADSRYRHRASAGWALQP